MRLLLHKSFPAPKMPPHTGHLLRLAGLACLLGSQFVLSAAAQTSEAPPALGNAAPGTALTPVPAPSPPAASPIPAMLGGADFLTIIDRPFDAEKLYRGVLAQDPNNTAAQAGLERAKGFEQPTVTFLVHDYQNELGPHSRLLTYGGGPTFRTPYGNATVLIGDGNFKQAGLHLRKSTLNVILDSHYDKYGGYLFLSGVKYYHDAPDRFLYNLRLSYLPQPSRERLTLISQREDSFLQSNQSQFFAPDSIFSIKSGLLLQQTGFEAEHALGDRIDLVPAYSYFHYSDGNSRSIASAQLFYRVLPAPKQIMPVFRVGLSYLYDDTKRPAFTYYAPVKFQSLSLAANYVMLTHSVRYGVFGEFPVTGQSGSPGGRYSPPKTLFAFVNYSLTDATELYLKATDVASPINSPSFTDLVFGVNQRF